MEELYWMTAIGRLNDVLFFLLIGFGIAGLTFLIMFLWHRFYDNTWDSEENLHLKYAQTIEKYLKTTVAGILFLSLSLAFTPSQKEMYAIVGIGTVVDYVQSSEPAKQFPDKAIEALNRYLDTIATPDQAE